MKKDKLEITDNNSEIVIPTFEFRWLETREEKVLQQKSIGDKGSIYWKTIPTIKQ